MTVYEVVARKDKSALRRTFPYLSEAFMFMREMAAEGWKVSDPKPCDPSGWLSWVPSRASVYTKEIT